MGGVWVGFFFNDTATTEIYTLSLHDALPISSIDIKLSDEGDYLKCPVIIRNGKMSVDHEELRKHLEYLFKMYEEATDEDKSFWGKLIEKYKPFMRVGEEVDNSFYISKLVI